MDVPFTSSTSSTAHGAHAIESEPEKKKKDEVVEDDEHLEVLESLEQLFAENLQVTPAGSPKKSSRGSPVKMKSSFWLNHSGMDFDPDDFDATDSSDDREDFAPLQLYPRMEEWFLGEEDAAEVEVEDSEAEGA